MSRSVLLVVFMSEGFLVSSTLNDFTSTFFTLALNTSPTWNLLVSTKSTGFS